MKDYVILLLVAICVTSARKHGMKSDDKRIMRLRNARPGLELRRSWGQQVPSFLSRHQILPRPNTRFLIPSPRSVSIRNSRGKRLKSRFINPAVNHGPSISLGSSSFRKSPFLKVATRSRELMKSSKNNIRTPASHLSMTHGSGRKRIIEPQKFSQVVGKQNSARSVRNHFTDVNTSNIRLPLVNKASSARLTGSKHGQIFGRSGFEVAPRRSVHARALVAPNSSFSNRSLRKTVLRHPITQHRQISGQLGSHVLLSMHRTQPHMVPLSRKLPNADRTSPVKKHLFKDMRSNFRSTSIKDPFSIAQPGFVSLNRKITSRSLAGAPSVHAISKSTPLIHKSSSHVDSASKPKKTTTQVKAAQIGHGDTVSNSRLSNIDQSSGTTGTADGKISRAVLIVAGSASGHSAANNAIVASQNHMRLTPHSLPNTDGAHSGNATLVSTSTIGSGKANTEAPNNQTISGVASVTESNNTSPTGTVSPNIKKLAWLIEIVNTREGLEEAMDDGALLSRLQQSGPFTYADLMFALRKGSHFNEEIIADMKSEGQWDQFLSAAGISPNDRIEHGRDKLAWLTEIANKREGLEEALDDGGLLRRLQPTGPHTYEELMAALRKGSHFSDAVISDMKSEGQWDQLLKAAGINPLDIGRQDRTSGTQKATTHTGHVTSFNPANVETDQAGRHNVSPGE